jgi:hypothetical protein
MSEFNKICVALIALCILLSCATPVQQMGQIQCAGRDGHIIYTGPYNAESLDEYVVQVDDWTRDHYHKGMCRKLPG